MRGNLVGQKGPVPHGARDQKWMRIPHRMAFQGGRKIGDLFTGMTLRQLGYIAGAGLARYQSFQHRLAGQSENVAENISNLHVGVF